MFSKLFQLLTFKERKYAIALLSMILLMALLDTIGVASIIPFISVLGNMEIVQERPFYIRAFSIAKSFGVDTTEQFLFVLGLLVFLFLLFSLIFKGLTTYFQLYFVQLREYSISKRLVEGYLNQPYSWFLNKHSADIGKSILSEVSDVVSLGFMPMLLSIANGTIAFFLLLLMIFVDPNMAITVGLTLGCAFAIIFSVTRRALKRSGEARFNANQKRFIAVSEAFGAAKEVKLGRLERIFTNRFTKAALSYAKNQSSAQIIGQLPRFALEAIAFGGMLLVAIFQATKSNGITNSLPTIALYAYAGYRLMPALQAIYNAVTLLRYSSPSIRALHKDLTSLNLARTDESGPFIHLRQAITLKNIQYKYPGSSEPVLKNISLSILARSMVGIVGTTGSGKTTTIDLILGLLEPQKGTLEIDGVVINDNNRRNWQRLIGYVPQQIYLADDTVAANIAFGVDPEDIDYSSVISAAKIANIHEFVSKELPQQYHTSVGERGIRLSGGQRQRIGIARALYHRPQVLILDEATSALDQMTEKLVMKGIKSIDKNITIIVIAHRLSTVKDCNNIFLFEEGDIVGEGTFNELVNDNEKFRALTDSK